MACIHPATIVNPHYKKFEPDVFPFDYWIKIPCGKCPECRKTRARDWKVRLFHELLYGNVTRAEFVTLTFSPRYYARFKDKPQKAIRLFLERYRRIYKRSLRHWFVTELGEDNGRLHIHGIVFNTRFQDKLGSKRGIKRYNRELRRLWKYGNTWVGYVKDKTISYVVKYILKPNEKFPDFVPSLYVTPGLGRCFVERSDVKRYYWNTSDTYFTVKINGREFPMPRYYVCYLFSDDYRKQLAYEKFVNPPPFRRFFHGKEIRNESSFVKLQFNEYRSLLESCKMKPLKEYTLADLPYKLGRTVLSMPDSVYKFRLFDLIEKMLPNYFNFYGKVASIRVPRA